MQFLNISEEVWEAFKTGDEFIISRFEEVWREYSMKAGYLVVKDQITGSFFRRDYRKNTTKWWWVGVDYEVDAWGRPI